MPLPLVPIVAGGALAALLFAGSKEKGAAPAPSAGSTSASPTQASTGGADGGAQVPSHSDTGAAQASETQAPSETVPGQDTTGAALGPVTADVSGITDGGTISVISTAVAPGTTKAPTAPTSSDGVSTAGKIAGASLGSSFGSIADATSKTVSGAFEVWGQSFGAIW